MFPFPTFIPPTSVVPGSQTFNSSGTFLRTEPMMQTGFTALGFTSDQIDAFYVAAAAL
jgi:hypothetical protein